MTFTQLGKDSFIHEVCDSSSREIFKKINCVYVYFKFFVVIFVILLSSLFLLINQEPDRDFKPITHSCRKKKIDSYENAPNAGTKRIDRKEKFNPFCGMPLFHQARRLFL